MTLGDFASQFLDPPAIKLVEGRWTMNYLGVSARGDDPNKAAEEWCRAAGGRTFSEIPAVHGHTVTGLIPNGLTPDFK